MKDAHPYELKNFSNIQNSAIQNWIQKGYAYFLGLGCTPDLKRACFYFKRAAQAGNQHCHYLVNQIKHYHYYWKLESWNSSYYDYDDADPLILGLYLAQAGWIEKGIRNCPGSIYWFKKVFKKLYRNPDVQPFAREFLKRYTAGMDATLPVIQFIKQKVSSDDAYYSFVWGVCLERGLSVEQDEKASFRWYMKAADAGQCLAFAALSRCYSEGIAVPVDLHMASVYKKKYHEASTETYATMGIIDVFDPTSFEETIYTKKSIQKQPVRSDGKDICRTLRALRARFAAANHIPWSEPDCPQKTPCSGTCPACEKALRKLTKLAQKQPDCTYPFFKLISHEPDVTVKPVKLKSLTPSEQYVDLLTNFCGDIDFTILPEHITNILKQYYIYVDSDLYYYLSLENAPRLPGLTEADLETLREYASSRSVRLYKIHVSQQAIKKFFASLPKKICGSKNLSDEIV